MTQLTIDKNVLRTEMQDYYNKITNSTMFDNITINKKVILYEVGQADLEPSKTKTNVKMIYGDMLKLINSNQQLRNELEENKKELQDKGKIIGSQKTTSDASASNEKRTSYAEVIKNEKKDYVVIVGKKERDAKSDLIKETVKILKSIKKNVLVD